MIAAARGHEGHENEHQQRQGAHLSESALVHPSATLLITSPGRDVNVQSSGWEHVACPENEMK
jgi:hypothetical protein